MVLAAIFPTTPCRTSTKNIIIGNEKAIEVVTRLLKLAFTAGAEKDDSYIGSAHPDRLPTNARVTTQLP